MTGSSAATPIRGRRAADGAEQQDVATYCARPSCNQEFRRAVQPGTMQLYCTETCRRKAEQEQRRLRSRLRMLEATVSQQRALLAAYGQDADETVVVGDVAAASIAVNRAAGVLRFISNDAGPTAEEFRLLYEAVAPLHRP